MAAPPTAAGKGEVFLFQKITSVWLTSNGKDKGVSLDIVSFGNNLLFLRLLERFPNCLLSQTIHVHAFVKTNALFGKAQTGDCLLLANN